MKRILLICTLLLIVLGAVAVPVKPGVWKTLTLSDGTEIRAQLKGDEFGHYWLGEDGHAYNMISDTDTYQRVDAQAIMTRSKARRSQANDQRMQRLPRRVGSVGNYTGEKRCLILLVNFNDKAFQTSHNNALYTRIANEEGYSEGQFVGSMADYFKAQSGGQFLLDFDVVGPLTVSKNASYYGSNNSQGDDKHPGEMVCEAVAMAKDLVEDWYQYDWDEDGYVDQIYVIYAGCGEADGGASTTIWPHQYELSSAAFYGDGTGPVTVAEGLVVDNYACGSELMSDNSIEGIGTMCHEFSHCLGYPDFYDIDYSGGQGMGPWDLMDGGSYNGNSFVPSGYTSYERWQAGWLEPIELKDENVTVENMQSLQSGGECYIIYNKGYADEFYLLENRQLDGWDSALPAKGLLILHCDYDAGVWASNSPNDDPNHQRMTVVPADGYYQSYMYMGTTYYTDEGIAADPFPQGTVNAFNKDFKTYDNPSKKAAQLFNKNANGTYLIDSSVEQITQNADGTISFNFVSANSGIVGPDPTEVLFYESFNHCEGKGANDGAWSGSVGANDFVADNEGWECVKSYGAYRCARFGTITVPGSAKTPAIALDGTTTMTFKAGVWNAAKDGTTLMLSVEGGTVEPAELTMVKGEWTDYTVTLTGSGSIRVTFAQTQGRFFLDEVVVATPTTTAVQGVRAQPSALNSQRIYTLDGRYVGTDVNALGRGIYIINGKKVVK